MGIHLGRYMDLRMYALDLFYIYILVTITVTSTVGSVMLVTGTVVSQDRMLRVGSVEGYFFRYTLPPSVSPAVPPDRVWLVEILALALTWTESGAPRTYH